MDSAVLIVLICHSMNPFDLGQCSEMWSRCSFCINWAKASDENGDPLSVDSVLAHSYCEMNDLILCVIGSVALDESL